MPGHIFVVEDDAAIQDVIDIVLSDAGYTVTVLKDAESFEKELSKFIPQLILLDLTLPGMDGGQIAKKLKSNEKFEKIPVILLSGMPNIKEVTQESDADGYLEKPFEVEKLLATVKKYVE